MQQCMLNLGFISLYNRLGEIKLKYNVSYIHPTVFLTVLSDTMPQLMFGNEHGKCKELVPMWCELPIIKTA